MAMEMGMSTMLLEKHRHMGLERWDMGKAILAEACTVATV
jgi:hypothetical protein